MHHYVVAGASGHTGSRVAAHLLAAGHRVTVIGRRPEALAELAAQGAALAIGDLYDTAFLTRTLQGARGYYSLVPPNLQAPDLLADQRGLGTAQAEAITAAGVPYVVALSSLGAHLEADSGVVLGLHYFEQALAQTGAHVLSLRAGFFFENFLGLAGLAATQGIMGGFPIRGDIAFPMVATGDIAAVAARRLLAEDFEGFSQQAVAGPRDLSLQEAAHILGAAAGQPGLPWIQFPYDQAEAGMIQMGMSPSVAAAYVAFGRMANRGDLTGAFTRDAANTTPTRLEDFAPAFAAAFAAVRQNA